MKKTLLILSLAIGLGTGLEAQNTDNALHFENNNYIDISNIAQDVSNLNEFTIEFWVKFNINDNDDYNSFYGVNPPDYTNRLNFRVAGPQDNIQDAAVILLRHSTPIYLIGTSPIGNDRCHHIAFTYNNQACSLYVDGALEASTNYYFEFQSTDLHSIGQEFDTGPVTSQFFNGAMDEFKIWNFAKTQTELAANRGFESTGFEAGLIAYYNFNQGNPNGNNTNISSITNLVQPTKNGTPINFSFNGNTSNFVKGECVQEAVGIEENELLNDFILSPNPTTGFINISDAEQLKTIIIKNNLGQVVMQAKPKNTIDISHLPRANYFVQIIDFKGNTKSLKLIKL